MTQNMNIADADFRITERLRLDDKEVHIWRVDLEAVRANESRWQKLLSPDESARASRFHFPRDRQSFTASRALLRTILAGYLASDPKELSFSYSKKEKPFLSAEHSDGQLKFNLSHSGDMAVLGFTRQRDIGIDVELVRRDFDPEPIARRFFSKHEQGQLFALPSEKRFEAFFRCWTRKEAYIKATGEGLSLPLAQFDVSLETGEMNALLATRPDGSEAGSWLLREVPSGPGYVAAVCVSGQDWVLRTG